LRRSEGCSLDATVPTGIRNQLEANPLYRQRGSLQSEQDIQVCPPQQAHRTPIPLSPTTTPVGASRDANYSWEEQSGGPTYETPADEYTEWMEDVMDGYLESLMGTEGTAILDMTEEQLREAGITILTLE